MIAKDSKPKNIWVRRHLNKSTYKTTAIYTQADAKLDQAESPQR